MAELNNKRDSQQQTLLNSNGCADMARCGEGGPAGSQELGVCGTGQLIMGRDSNAIRPYTTRYRINRRDAHPCRDACVRALLPCVTRDNSTACVDCVTAFLKSEAFLLAVHLSAVAIAVVKECLPVISLNDKLHFVLTVCEKVLCIACILLRVFAVYNEYKDVNEALIRMEASENNNSIYSKSVRLWSVIFTLLSSVVIFVVLAAFILLHMYVHLGWTILSTSTALLVVLAFHHVLKARNDLVLFRITLDHHKVLLEESVMFLKEGLCFKGWVNQDFLLRCRHYVLAYDVTREFRRPKYIDVCETDQLCISLNVSSV